MKKLDKMFAILNIVCIFVYANEGRVTFPHRTCRTKVNQFRFTNVHNYKHFAVSILTRVRVMPDQCRTKPRYALTMDK
jgi:hypothetical protein